MAANGIQKKRNPRLAGKVVEAIQAIHETEGATTKGITNYLQNNTRTGSEITENDIALALMKAVDKGMVVAKCGRYKVARGGAPGMDATDGRRRRRSKSGGRRKRSRSRRKSRGGKRRRSRSRRH